MDRGGAERVVLDLSNALAEKGHEVDILTAIPIDRESLPVTLDPRITLRSVRRSSGTTISAYFGLLLWLLPNRSWVLSRDIIHCHLTFGAVFGIVAKLARFLAHRLKPAILETYHAVGLPIPKSKRWLHRLMLAQRDRAVLMALDPYWERFCVNNPHTHPVVILNGVSAPSKPTKEAARRYRAASGISHDALVVGSVGRLVPERRPDLLFDAFVALAARRDDVHLLLAGKGPERDGLLARATQLGLEERIHLPGLVLNPAEAFSTIDLYWTINVGATTGVAALEAALFGRPIIALQLDLNYHATGQDWIWSTSDPNSLADRSVEMLFASDCLEGVAQAQKAHAIEAHGVELMTMRYIRLYEEAVAQSQAR